MRKTLLALLVCILSVLTAMADLPFRNHRYDGFKALKVNSGSIVFVGNSITNMHEWWEAFGDHKILNRGVSGAVSSEMLANLEDVLAGKPKKIFFMIGTNDLGTNGLNTAAQVAKNVRTAIRRCKTESPETRVYMQSILPSGKRDLNLQKQTNDSIRKICAEFTDVTYIDLWDDLYSVTTGSNSLDKLHLSASGYSIWCNKIKQYLDGTTVYPEGSTTDSYCGLGSSNGMRTSYFLHYPIKEGDILMLGDEMIHGGEWHEYFGSDKVKNRGTGWGFAGITIENLKAQLPNILHGSTMPARIYVYIGMADACSSSFNSTTATNSYTALVDEIKALAPAAKLYLLTLLPNTNDADIATLNAGIKSIASTRENVEVIDLHTQMQSYKGNAAYFTGNYVYALGYAKIANILAPAMGLTATTVSMAEAETQIALLKARKSIANALERIDGTPIGEGVGEISAEAEATAKAKVAELQALLQSTTATVEELTAKANGLDEALFALLNLPKSSTEAEPVYYTIYNPGKKLYMSNSAAGSTVAGVASCNSESAQWKFVKLADGSFNIVNRATGAYIGTTAGWNSAVSSTTSAPAEGWTLSYSDKAGTFIIKSGTCQLNQTNATGSPIYNWSANKDGLDRSDPNGMFTIERAEEVQEVPRPIPFASILEEQTLTGTPVKIADDIATKVLAKKTLSVAVEVTPSDLSTSIRNVVIGSTNSDHSKHFSTVISKSDALGIQYVNNSEGWFTRTTGSTISGKTRIVYTFDEASYTYKFYRNGTKTAQDVTLTRSGEWPYTVYGFDGADALYLGGIPFTSANITNLNGTIHSVRFYDSALTADQIAGLNWPGSDEDGSDPSDNSIELFGHQDETAIPYRIPALAQASNGNLIAVADYRYSKEDIGVAANGELDIRGRISRDNGQTWDPLFTIADGNGQGGSGTAAFNNAFGDPCLVADRESGKVLMLSCAGNVSFPAGTAGNHQDIAYFLSEDNGLTWSEPQRITDQFYDVLKTGAHGPVHAMFVGSGKIHQSRYTKVGETYRLYCTTLTETAANRWVNFVYYSDDFGLTWKLLGNADTPAIAGGSGNEPKIEELPDGSILISSRSYGGGDGRYFNIFTFTDADKAEGSWGSEAFSGKTNNGTFSTSCNGEILLVPAIRKADQKQVWVALQSAPAATNRSKVSIYYKELPSLAADFKDAATFAKDWDGIFQITERASAYSTMILKQDNHIGFFFEEDRYGIAKGYTMVYRDLTLEEITDTLYSPCPKADFDETTIFRGFGQERVQELGKAEYIGEIAFEPGQAVKDALATFEATTTMKNYEALTRAIQQDEANATGTPLKLESGRKYTMANKTNEAIFFTVNGTIGFKGAAKTDDGTQIWTITTTPDGYWTLYNEATGVYVANTVADNKATPQATTEATAAKFEIVANTNGDSYLACQAPQVSGHHILHYAPQLNNQIVGWNTSTPASFWRIKLYDDGQSAIDSVRSEAHDAQDNRIFDLQGRQVLRPAKGVYIVGGKKVLIK